MIDPNAWNRLTVFEGLITPKAILLEMHLTMLIPMLDFDDAIEQGLDHIPCISNEEILTMVLMMN